MHLNENQFVLNSSDDYRKVVCTRTICELLSLGKGYLYEGKNIFIELTKQYLSIYRKLYP